MAAVTLTCVWWNFNTSQWDARGCTTNISGGLASSNATPTTPTPPSSPSIIASTVQADGSVSMVGVECTCTHLTNCAVLVSLQAPGDDDDDGGSGAGSSDMLGGSAVQVSLSLVSTVGCCISIVCMAALVLTIVWLRRHKFINVHHHILTHLCICLIG